MPSISKIRLTNVVYEEGNKRYNDELFLFDGHNGAILLENGGGKTVLIQTAMQAILPHVDLADRKIKNTLILENAPAHIAIEWIINDNPRRYVVTAVSLFTTKNGLDSLRYVYEYDANDPNGIEGIPFVRDATIGKRTAERGEMQDYYSQMRDKSFSAQTITTIKDYKIFLEEQYNIISREWESIAKINSSEGGVEAFFDDCKSTNQLFDRLLIPTVEDSIVGHDEMLFADMFEQQHTSFKNYKKLKETIEENKQIEVQLDKYVGTFEKLHNRELHYEKSKQKAKGVWNVTLDQRQKLTSEQHNTIEKLNDWKQSNQAYQVKFASYNIFVEETAFKKLERAYHEVLAIKNVKEENLLKHNKDYYSLKLAELKLDKKAQEDALKHIKEELATFDQKEEARDYQEQLEEASRALLGWYMEEMEGLEKDKKNLNYELNPILDQIAQSEKKKSELAGKELGFREELSKLQGTIESRLRDIERLKQQLLSNPNQEDVKEELESWQDRSQFLDDEIIRLRKQEKELHQEEMGAEKQKETLQATYTETNSKKKQIAYQLSVIDDSQKEVINHLAMLREQWQTLDNIYLSQQSIEERIIETLTRLEKEREKQLYQERLSYRFVDDHSNQETFFGDAFLEKQLATWKNQFDYLVTGVEYLQSIKLADKEKLKGYALWPVTLVTTNKSKQKVIEKLKHISDRLQFPIHVLSTEEALVIHEDKANQTWISPSQWSNNLDAASFSEWKSQIGNRAQEITKRREEKEQEIKRWEDGLKALNQYLEAHPYEKVAEMQSEHSTLSTRLEELSSNLRQVQESIVQLREMKKQTNEAIRTSGEEKLGLDGKLEKGQQFIQYEKEVEEGRKREKIANENLKQVTRELGVLRRQMEGLVAERGQLVDRLNSMDTRILLLQEEDEYQELQSLSPIFTKESKPAIKSKLIDLDMKIREIKQSEDALFAKQEAAVSTINRLDKQMNELYHEHSDIDDDRNFPGDGKQLMQSLWQQITTMKDDIEKIAVEVGNKKSLMDQQKGKWENQVSQFGDDYPNNQIQTFTKSIEEIADELRLEKKTLEERKTFIDQELNRIENDLKSVEEAKHGLELFVEGHHFNAPHIDALPLSTDEVLEFTYNRKKYVNKVTDELKSNKEKVLEEQKEVDKAKRKFREFGAGQISDIKLQQMAINGVENKHNYKDITEFRKNMLTRIKSISHYANEHIRQSDEDLQLFINQIHSHLQTLVEELKQIPKKTRVKVGDDWKQVFTFTIPEWEEEVGKMRIRDYIEWILKQLESDKYLNEQGMQNDGKVRKDIEMWLQSKQLLQMILNHDVMKVSCRKVTNDNQVSRRSYTWEQSNVWSGGEKWSKNMTLFLGILNYVAEKKKHIQSNMKRHRAVILDNPFGKASSDHVLSPVFFVAEQLGFQIIALTAHAEGKFLQDYFPVIYSCRLRASVDPNKKVMTKEKWLHHAYFHDHEPNTMSRLDETEQMVLFE